MTYATNKGVFVNHFNAPSTVNMQKKRPQNVVDRAVADADAWQAYDNALDLRELGGEMEWAMVNEIGNAAQYVADQKSAAYHDWQKNYSAWTRGQWPLRTESDANKFAAEFDFDKIEEIKF